MVRTRSYEKTRTSIECHVYEGNKLVLHLVYYPGFHYGYPRYHFENFCLQLPYMNYEILRFMKFINKLSSNPGLDLDSLDMSLNNDFTDSLF